MQIWNKTNDYIRKYAWKLVKACIIKYFMGICSKYKQLTVKGPTTHKYKQIIYVVVNVQRSCRI